MRCMHLDWCVRPLWVFPMEVRFATTSYLLVIHHRHQPNWEICYVQGAPGLAIYAIILLDTYIIYIYISFMWVVSLVNIFLWAQGIYCQLEVDQALLGSSPPSKPQLGALALLAGWYWHSSSSCREVGCGCWSSQYPVWFFATQDFGNCCAEPRHLDYHYNI